MTNKLAIVATKFENVADEHVSWGYRIYDDHAANYINHWDRTYADEMELLQAIIQEDDSDVIAMIDHHVCLYPKGIEINGNWYEADELAAKIDAWRSQQEEEDNGSDDSGDTSASSSQPAMQLYLACLDAISKIDDCADGKINFRRDFADRLKEAAAVYAATVS